MNRRGPFWVFSGVRSPCSFRASLPAHRCLGSTSVVLPCAGLLSESQQKRHIFSCVTARPEHVTLRTSPITCKTLSMASRNAMLVQPYERLRPGIRTGLTLANLSFIWPQSQQLCSCLALPHTQCLELPPGRQDWLINWLLKPVTYR